MTINSNDHPYKVVVEEGDGTIYANNHPIKVNVKGGVVTPAEFEELERKVDALATDLSYKGGVPTYADLPSDPEQGDVYTTEDTGVLWVWDGIKWVALNDSKKAITGSTDPTSSTEGEVGQLYLNTTTGKVYILQTIDTSTTPATYTWIAVGPTVVQTTGRSTTDVMSQNAVGSMVFNDPGTNSQVKIGLNTLASRPKAIAIGEGAQIYADFGIAIGTNTRVSHTSSVALGSVSVTSRANEVSVGYGSTPSSVPTRYIANVTDPQLPQDAATKSYVDSHSATVLTNSQFNQIIAEA